MSYTARAPSASSGRIASGGGVASGSQTTRTHGRTGSVVTLFGGGSVSGAGGVPELTSPSSNGPDYSSTGASCEETRAERYTRDFVRALTPRTLHACAENGVLARELLFRPASDFLDEAIATAATGQNKDVRDTEDEAPDAMTQAVAEMRFKDYEKSRVVALNRVRATRRRNISGTRGALFGLPSPPPSGSAHSHHAILPAVASAVSYGGGLAHASRGASRHSQRCSHGHSAAPGFNGMPGSSPYPPQHQLKEHPFFKAHPQHDRVHGLQAGTAGSDWSATLPHGAAGHVCVRMRDHLVRDRARAEWDASEARREARERRRREQRENEWYQEKKQALRRARKTGDPAVVVAALAHANEHTPRITRTEMLRAAGVNSLFQAQQAAAVLAATGANTPVVNANIASASSTAAITASHERKASTSVSNSGLALTMPLPQPSSSRDSTGGAFASTVGSVSGGGGGTAVGSHGLANSASFADRHLASMSTVADKYARFFAREKTKIVARQEAEIARLAESERARHELARKQEELARRRTERARTERTRREQLASEQQRAREAKLSRVAVEEAERVARIETAWRAREERLVAHRAEQESLVRSGVRARQTATEAADEERKWRLEAAYHERHRALVEGLRRLHARAEESRERLVAERAAAAAEREAKGLSIDQKLSTAAQRIAEEDARRVRQHMARCERHADRDLSVLVRRAAEVAAQRAARSQARDDQKALVLGARAAEHEERCDQILSKEERDERRMREREAQRAEQLALAGERKRIDAARKARNLERESRRVAFAHAERSRKVEADLARLEALREMKAEFVSKREAFAKQSLADTRDFRDTYARLRTHGALAAIVKEAKQRQKEMDQKQQEEKYA